MIIVPADLLLLVDLPHFKLVFTVTIATILFVIVVHKPWAERHIVPRTVFILEVEVVLALSRLLL